MTIVQKPTVGLAPGCGDTRTGSRKVSERFPPNLVDTDYFEPTRVLGGVFDHQQFEQSATMPGIRIKGVAILPKFLQPGELYSSYIRPFAL